MVPKKFTRSGRIFLGTLSTYKNYASWIYVKHGTCYPDILHLCTCGWREICTLPGDYCSRNVRYWWRFSKEWIDFDSKINEDKGSHLLRPTEWFGKLNSWVEAHWFLNVVISYLSQPLWLLFSIKYWQYFSLH